jgi:hypothetical protein
VPSLSLTSHNSKQAPSPPPTSARLVRLRADPQMWRPYRPVLSGITLIRGLWWWPVGFPRIWEIGGATSGVDRVYGFINAANSQIRCGVLANGVTATDFLVKTDPTPASGKLAFAFADDDFSGVIDGGSPVTDTSGSFTTPSIPRNTLKIGGEWNSAASNMGGHIKSIQYYPRRLTNSQLQRLTS